MLLSENGLVMNKNGNHMCLSCPRAQIFGRDHWVAHKESSQESGGCSVGAVLCYVAV